MKSMLLPGDMRSGLFPEKDDGTYIFLCGGTGLLRRETLRILKNCFARECDEFYSIYGGNELCALNIPQKSAVIADSVYFGFHGGNYPKPNVIFLSLDDFSDVRPKFETPETNKSKNAFAVFNENCKRYLCASAAAKKVLNTEAEKSLDKRRIVDYAVRFLKRSGTVVTEKKSRPKLLRASAVTPWGVECVYDEFETCETVFVIKDECGALSNELISAICGRLQKFGENYQVYFCSLSSLAEHLIIPSLSVGFFTENSSHKYDFRNRRNLSASRFLPPQSELLKTEAIPSALLSEFLDEAVFSLFEATRNMFSAEKELSKGRENASLLCAEKIITSFF
ncbi:MAG: hypothetical protein MR019_07725 [Ruminococcus sp.]|nr:hypothetical protein [Ruminococcus sp.]MDY3895655.1 hypothetical protein [Candidatus Fimenecus sp.]